MDLPPISFPKALARPAPEPATGAPSDRVARGEEAPRSAAPSSRVGVEMDRSHGLPVARLIDLRSGLVISQTPFEQVLDVVAGLMELIHRKELGDGDGQS